MKIETERLATRIRVEDKKLIEKAAALSGVSVSAFIKTHLRKAALDVFEEEQVVKLNVEDSLKFAEALLTPPKPTPAVFKKAWKSYKDSVVES